MPKKLMQVPAVSIVLFFFTEPLIVSALILFFHLFKFDFLTSRFRSEKNF
jgi:hypothetical protein